MWKMRFTVAAAALLLVWSGVSADFDAGMKAYRDGDYESALEQWKPLAEAGVTEAQYGIAVMYENGQGLPQDPKKAFEWYLKAANQGDANAQFMVAVYYGRGDVVQTDPVQAHGWYDQAAGQGHTAAMVFLAMTYLEGRGAPQDSILAYMWAKRASIDVQGERAAEVEKLIEQITDRMTPEELEEATQRIRRLTEKNAWRPCLLDEE